MGAGVAGAGLALAETGAGAVTSAGAEAALAVFEARFVSPLAGSDVVDAAAVGELLVVLGVILATSAG